MDNISGDNYRAMLMNFRISDLQKLLKAFGKNVTGRRLDLLNLAFNLLDSKPFASNYGEYLMKIIEIHNDQMRNSTHSQQTRIMYLNRITQVPQQETQTNINPFDAKYTIPGNAMATINIQPMPGSYQPMGPNSNIQRVPGSYQSITLDNNIQRVPGSYQPTISNNAVSPQFSSNQHNYMPDMVTQNSVGYYLNTVINEYIPLTLTPEIVAQHKFTKLPFYEVQEEIIKPTLLSGSEKCSLPKLCRGTRESTFVHTMSLEQATLISMNRDFSYGQNKFLYQYQIRFCQPKFGHSEVTDFLPVGLQIRIGEKECTLPPNAPTRRNIDTTRRIAGPIDCTQLLKLNPNLANHITINWIPDGKNYAVAVFLVKKLSSNDLINQLLEKEPKSSEETRKNIIKKLKDIDPDFATTSYHFSLLCPLSKTRMNLPAKSIHCDHLQCFDAKTFILMNEQKQTWTCPTCKKPCLYDNIAIENYFLEIIMSPSLQVNDKEIDILADGSWIICKENRCIKNTIGTLNTAKPTISIDLDANDDEIAAKSKKELVPESSVKQESIDYINVDDSDDEVATKPKKKLVPESSVKQEPIDYINVDDSDDEVATKPKKKLVPESSVKQESIDYINVDDSDDEITTEPKINLRPKYSGMQELIDSINVDDSDDEIATEPQIDLRPKYSGMQELIDSINVDDSDDEIATESQIDLRPKYSGMQELIDSINVDDSDDEIATEPKIELRPTGSEKQKSKNLKSLIIDLTNEDEKPLNHEVKLENEGQAADVGQPVTQLVLQPKDQVQPQQIVISHKKYKLVQSRS